MEIKIEKNVPIPVSRAGELTVALRKLMKSQIGDSIYVPDEAGKYPKIRANQLGGPGWVKTAREGNGHRIWKVAEPWSKIDVL